MLAACSITAICTKFLFARYPYRKLEDVHNSTYDAGQTTPIEDEKESGSVVRV